MRGVVSLAAALALPLTVQDNKPFPARDLIVFITFVVILVTLVVQGLSLPPLIRFLRVEDDRSMESEEHEALLEERQTIVELRDQDIISDEVLRRIQRDIDLAEARLGDGS